MTYINFDFQDSYHKPTTGFLAFTPHRKHAFDETIQLPKPFTIVLDNGKARVNLQPNDESWVWIITLATENGKKLATSFHTVPSSADDIEYTKLHRVDPNSLPRPYDSVEPVWWSEIRDAKQIFIDALLEIGVAQHEVAEQWADIESWHSETQTFRDQTQDYANTATTKAYEAQTIKESVEQTYASLENLGVDAVVRQRGTLPDDTDLNTMGADYIGVWSLSAGFSYDNVPMENNTSAATLEIMSAGISTGAATVQRFTLGTQAGENGQMFHYIRESLSGNLGWSPWQKILTALEPVSMTRGTLPAGRDLDTVTGVEDVGFWVLIGGREYPNSPVNGSVGATVFTVERASESTIYQKVSNGSTFGSSVTGTWWRESNANGNFLLPWRKIMSTDDWPVHARGMLPDNTDLDELTRTYAGIWQLSSLSTYHNMPESLPGTAGTLEVLTSGVSSGNATIQRITVGTSTGGGFVYWRESISGNAGWSPWKRLLSADENINVDLANAVTSPTVSEIIVSADANQTLQPGQILLVVSE